jgi:hypothetical protein
VGWNQPGCCPQMVCQVSDVGFPQGLGATKVRASLRRPVLGQPPNQPLLLSNGRRRKSGIKAKTIYKGCNLGARLFGLSRTGFFI